MKQFLIGTLAIFLCACGGNDSHEGGDSVDNDTTDNLVVYDLDEDRISAVEFNNEMTLMQEDMLNVIGILFQSDSSNAKINYDNALFEAEINLSELKDKSFDGSEKTFVAEMKNLMNFYISELKGDFKTILPLLEKSELSDKENQMLKDYDEKFAFEEKEIFMKVIEEQDKFAKKHNIKLVDQ